MYGPKSLGFITKLFIMPLIFILIRRMFYHSLPTHKYLVMTTYIIAQTLITYGIVNKNNIESNEYSEIKQKINDINMDDNH